ncbi:MAG TPA: Ig-like domain-containing protein, partial [Solirubrobacteraceae bacterium]|nr:Ig-like domain-containing protein [Solirubrobacteraceae bacterium]
MVGKVVARATLVGTLVFVVFLVAPGLVAASSAALTITKPSSGESVASSTPSFAGTTSDMLDSITVSIYAGGAASGTPVQTLSVLVPIAGSWEVGAESSLIDGEYTVVAEQAGEASAPVTFTVDFPPPVVTIDPVAARTKDSTPTLEGSAGDSASVEVTVEGPSASKGAAVLSGGGWSYTPAAALPDGTYTARAVGKDSAGNVGESSAVTFTVDTVAPAVTLESVASPTNDATPTLKGSAGVAAGDVASVEVAIYKGFVASGTPARSETVVPNGGNWTYTPAPPLPEGTYTAQAVQEDEAGNVGTSMPPVTFVVDTTPPTLTFEPVAARTKDSTPTFEGSAGDSASVEVTVEGPSASKGAAVLSGGGWSYTPAAALPDGTYTARAAGKDLAGNVRERTVTFTVDTVAPSVTLESLATETNDTTPTLKGSAGVAAGDDKSVEVTIYRGLVPSGSVASTGAATISGGGSWTYKPASALTEGPYTAQAIQDDEAGNVGTSMPPVTFTVVTAKPVVTIKSIASPTRGTEPALSGNAGDSASVEVTIEGPSPSVAVASKGK